jgi:hypothetical protein
MDISISLTLQPVDIRALQSLYATTAGDELTIVEHILIQADSLPGTGE